MGMESIFKLSVVLGVVDNLSNKMQNINSNVNDSVNNLNTTFQKMQNVGATMSTVGGSIAGAALSTVTATFDTQDALGELASLGVKDLGAVEDAARDFSNKWAGTVKSDFITAAYDIKSGIASLTDEGVAKFTELSGLTAKATKSTTGEMTSLFATAYGIYKDQYSSMSDMEFGEMFSGGLATAVKNYKTSGSEMAGAIQTIGATATNANVSMEEQLAILGQLQATMSGSEAGTKYKAFLNAASGAGEKLGLSFTDANNKLLSTPEILEKLKEKYGDTIDAVEKQELKSAFGTDEAIAMIDLLYNKTDTLKNGISDLASSMKKGTENTTSMAEAIQNTPAQKFETIKQQIHNNVEALGSGLLPAINQAADKVSGLIKKSSDWISSNQSTVNTIMKLVLYLGIFFVVMGSALGIIGTAGKAFTSLKTSIDIVKRANTLLNASFLTSPVTWVIIGIVALVAAFVLLYKKCDSFRNFWNGTFGQIKDTFQSAWSNIQPGIQTAGEKLKELGVAAQPIIHILAIAFGTTLVQAIGMFVGILTGAASAAKPLINAFSDLVSFVANVINAIVALFRGDFTGACDYAGVAVNNIKSFFIHGFTAIASFITGFANGFLDTVRGALKSVGINASAEIGKMKSVVSKGMNAVKNVFSTVMTAAADTVKQKLNNMKSAYKSHGGGIKGIAAAAMEGVKGKYTAGFTFIDNLTGGKLTSIKNKVTNKFTSIVTSIQNKMNSAKEKVKSGIDKIKGFLDFKWSLPKLKLPHFSATGKFSLNPLSIPKFGVEWYKNGGIMTSPTIFGANGSNLMVGGEAGAEAIVPLSELWKNLRELFHSESSESESNTSVLNVKELFNKESKTSKEKEKTVVNKESKTSKSGNVVIQKLELKVDISKLKDLNMLYKLIDELKDSQNSSDDDLVME